MAMLPVALHHNSVCEPLQQEEDGAPLRAQGLGWNFVQTVGFAGSTATALWESPVTEKQQTISALVDLIEWTANRSGALGDCRAFDRSRAVIDSSGGESTIPTVLDHGVIHFVPILNAASENGVQWLVVEQDQARWYPMESALLNAACMRIQRF